MTHDKTQLVSFSIDEQLLAIPIDVVERIIRAVEVTPLGNAPPTILGIIDYRGNIIPVLNLRNRLGFPDRPVKASDRIMIIQTTSRKQALVVDEMRAVLSVNNEQVSTREIFNETIDAQGIARSGDGLILIYDPETFLSSDEEVALNNLLKNKKNR